MVSCSPRSASTVSAERSVVTSMITYRPSTTPGAVQPVTRGAWVVRLQTTIVRVRVVGAVAEPGSKVTRIVRRWRPGEKMRLSGSTRRWSRRISRVPRRRPSTLTRMLLMRSPVTWIWEARATQPTLLAVTPEVPARPASGGRGPGGRNGSSDGGEGPGSGVTGGGVGPGCGVGGTGGSGGASGQVTVVVIDPSSVTTDASTVPVTVAVLVISPFHAEPLRNTLRRRVTVLQPTVEA